MKPDVCRRKLADRHLRARKPEMALSCEITRTCARVIHLTTGTFNLIVKDRKQDPPEGTAFSPERNHTSANPSVLETFQTYRAELLRVNPLCSQDFHLIFTLGSCYRLSRRRLGPCDSGTLKDSNARLPLELWAEIHSAPAHGTRQRKSSNLRKDHLEVVATNAKPFEEPCPRIKTPWPGLISELLSLLTVFRCCQNQKDSNIESATKFLREFSLLYYF